MDAVADHRIALRDERKVARDALLNGGVLRAVAGLVDRLAAGDAADDGHAAHADLRRGILRGGRPLPGEQRKRHAELGGVILHHGQPRDALLGFIPADDLLGGAQNGRELILSQTALLADGLEHIAEFHGCMPPFHRFANFF